MLSVLETADAELSALAEGGSAAGGAGPRQEGSDSEDERSKDGGGFKLWRPQHAPTSADGEPTTASATPSAWQSAGSQLSSQQRQLSTVGRQPQAAVPAALGSFMPTCRAGACCLRART
jgi:hypothetical protein